MRRLAVVFVAAAAAVLLSAAPASAHTVSGGGATNFRSRLLTVAPNVPGLTVRVVENGRRMELTNVGSTDVTVLGYLGEPYLRVGPAGVFENTRSPSVLLNAPNALPAPPGPAASAAGPPLWRRLSGAHTVFWHDHRTHWVGGVPAALVRHATPAGLVLRQWRIELRAGDQQVEAVGVLAYVPGPSPWPWLGLAVALAAGVLAAARTRWWTVGIGAAVAVLVATDVVHTVGIGLAYTGSMPQRVGFILSGSYYSLVAWVVGVLAVVLLARRSVDGLFAAIFTGLVLGLWSGVADLSVLYRSQPPFAGPAVVERLAVTAAIGLGVGVVAGSALVLRRERRETMAAAVS